MLELLNNGWVVGLGGGVASGMIVAWLTKIFFSNKNNKEISLAIFSANREILYALRSEITEEVIPSASVLNALRNATARKYDIESHHLLTVKEIGEELIKEIMDSSFISSQLKRSYCQKLEEIKDSITVVKNVAVDTATSKAKLEYRSRMTHLFSVTFGSIAALVTLYFVLKNILKSDSFVSQIMGAVLPTIAVMMAFVLLMTAMQVAFKLRYRRIKAENNLNE